MINCPICGKKLEVMNPAHCNKHGMTLREFKDKYPEVASQSFPKLTASKGRNVYLEYTNEHITKRMRKER